MTRMRIAKIRRRKRKSVECRRVNPQTRSVAAAGIE